MPLAFLAHGATETTEPLDSTTTTFWFAAATCSSRAICLAGMVEGFAIEALDSKHPAHDYFADRERRSVTNALNINWSVPDGANVEHVLQAGLSMMDGIQLRWLRSPGRDLNAMWVDCEDVLFPSPLWDGYR